MTTTPKSGSTRSCFQSVIAGADLRSKGREDRCRAGRNGHMHRSGRRGMGPGIQRRVRRDNVGKGHLPAGAGGNLRRPAVRGIAEGGGRDLVWRMSPYERGGRGNARRRRAGHGGADGHAGGARGGSGHSVAPNNGPDAELGERSFRSRGDPAGKLLREGVYASQRLSFARVGKACRGNAEVRTGFGKTDRPGSQGGLRKRELWRRLNGHVPWKHRNSQAFA